jgi:hypothetical protein
LTLSVLCLVGCSSEPIAPSATVETTTLGATTTLPASTTTTTRPAAKLRTPVWPEGSSSAVAAAIPRLAAGQDTWRASPEATAERFVFTVLKWPTAHVERDSTMSADTSMWYRVSGGSRGDTATLELIPITEDRRWWAVAYGRLAGGGDELFNVSVSVTGMLASVNTGPGWWTNEVARAELRIGHGLSERTIVATSPPVRWSNIELAGPPIDTGYVTVIFQSADGQAVGFLATGLPAGDFTAS